MGVMADITDGTVVVGATMVAGTVGTAADTAGMAATVVDTAGTAEIAADIVGTVEIAVDTAGTVGIGDVTAVTEIAQRTDWRGRPLWPAFSFVLQVGA
jgi:hypothetical protein